MKIDSFLSPSDVHWGLEASSYKRALESISQEISSNFDEIDTRALFKALVERERLGSTGVGKGVAIPHCRIQGIDTIFGAFFKLSTPIDYLAPDDQPVDLLFTLVVPEDCSHKHLAALAAISEKLGDDDVREKIRSCSSADCVYNLLTKQ